MAKDNLTLLTTPINEQRAQLELLKRTLDVHMEFLEINAKIVRAKYVSLLGQGFTEQQALELCK